MKHIIIPSLLLFGIQIGFTQSSYKKEITLSYDIGAHLLWETFGESYFNCPGEDECNVDHFDYGIIRAAYRYNYSRKFTFGFGINMMSIHTTSGWDVSRIIEYSKIFFVPLFVEYNYINNDKFRLSSGAGTTFSIFLIRDISQGDIDYKVVPEPFFNVQLLQLKWVFDNRLSPLVSLGLGSSLVNTGISYRFN